MSEKKVSILEQYLKQLEEDRQNENKDFPDDTTLEESDKEMYEQTLDELRNSSLDLEAQYQERKKQMCVLNEAQMKEKEKIKDEEVKLIVRHAYCDECGEELISKTPSMFNPFTFEKICKHTCDKCGKVFNLEYAYPRAVYLNNEGIEINAFGL